MLALEGILLGAISRYYDAIYAARFPQYGGIVLKAVMLTAGTLFVMLFVYSTGLVRVIDASYIAPAVNIYVANTLFAGNVGEGYISNYGITKPSPAAVVKVTQANTNKALVTASMTLAMSDAASWTRGLTGQIICTAVAPSIAFLTAPVSCKSASAISHPSFVR